MRYNHIIAGLAIAVAAAACQGKRQESLEDKFANERKKQVPQAQCEAWAKSLLPSDMYVLSYASMISGEDESNLKIYNKIYGPGIESLEPKAISLCEGGAKMPLPKWKDGSELELWVREGRFPGEQNSKVYLLFEDEAMSYPTLPKNAQLPLKADNFQIKPVFSIGEKIKSIETAFSYLSIRKIGLDRLEFLRCEKYE